MLNVRARSTSFTGCLKKKKKNTWPFCSVRHKDQLQPVLFRVFHLFLDFLIKLHKMADGAPRVKLAIQMFEPFSAVFREHRENSAVGKKNSILLLFFECFLFFLVGGFPMAARGDLIFFFFVSLFGEVSHRYGPHPRKKTFCLMMKAYGRHSSIVTTLTCVIKRVEKELR